MSAPSLEDRLAKVVVEPRADLVVSRHVFRGAPAYIVRDPVTFETHALEPREYAVFAELGRGEALGAVADRLVREGAMDAAERSDFFEFVLSLHRIGLLALPVSDGKSLFERYERKRGMRRKSLAMSVFFLRAPLWNPDAFLDRTVRWTRWLFTRWALGVWALLMLACAVLVVARWDDLRAPLLTVMEFNNLPLLWVVLVGLKVLHEFGHAYACKAFGGPVPEMGAFFIVGTPCAYVDASASWGFPSVRQRLAVSLAGMYIESLCAGAALFVWAATPPGLLNSLAYQVLLLASVVTLGFNLNPLAKFDGYYILSDLLGIPNLRQRASERLLAMFNRVALGIRDPAPPGTLPGRVLLAGFGLASSVYRVMLVVSISAMIATKFFLIGVGLAGVYFVNTVAGMMLRSVRYLWWSPATSRVRARAVLVSALGLGLLPVMGAMLPAPGGGQAWGVLERERVVVIRASEPGTVSWQARPGQTIEPGTPVAIVENAAITHAALVGAADLELASREHRRADSSGAGASAIGAERFIAAQARAAEASDRAARLVHRASCSGDAARMPAPDQPGRPVRAGEPLAEVVSGGWIVELVIDEEALLSARLALGEPLECRVATRPDRVINARITSIEPAGARDAIDPRLTQEGVNAVPVSPPQGGRTAGRAYFRLVASIDETTAPAGALRRGASVRARLEAEYEPLASALGRRVVRFLNDLRSR
ncbi:MAG TPA: hypothetical protein DEB06_09570 [Phycisphaerales bacterium]|nr:hypothetical protein [Phycisphaerales bacterium]